MMKRIGLWAFTGFAIAVCWALIAAIAGPHYNLGRSAFVEMTVPISWVGRRIPLTYYAVILMNAATYMLMGFALEPFMRLYRRHR